MPFAPLRIILECLLRQDSLPSVLETLTFSLGVKPYPLVLDIENAYNASFLSNTWEEIVKRRIRVHKEEMWYSHSALISENTFRDIFSLRCVLLFKSIRP